MSADKANSETISIVTSLAETADVTPLSANKTIALLADLRDLPASFHVIEHALDLMPHSECTNERLQEILMADPAASAGITRLANSAYFGVAARIRTPATAIRVVGHRRLETLLRHLIVGRLFELLAAEHPMAETLRTTALVAAAVGAGLTSDWADEAADELRLIGVIHNLGELALLTSAPAEYLAVRALIAKEPETDAEVIAREYFGMGFAEITAWLLEGWRFPREQVEAVRRWPAPWSADDDPPGRLTLAAHVAASLARDWDQTQPAEESVDPRALEELGVNPMRLRQIRAETPTELQRLKSWLF